MFVGKHCLKTGDDTDLSHFASSGCAFAILPSPRPLNIRQYAPVRRQIDQAFDGKCHKRLTYS
jgi:hypothetical protein